MNYLYLSVFYKIIASHCVITQWKYKNKGALRNNELILTIKLIGFIGTDCANSLNLVFSLSYSLYIPCNRILFWRGLLNELPNSLFKNGRLTRNWSNLFMILFAYSIKH